jgi:tetratricopeptide (TPR) repeat protein
VEIPDVPYDAGHVRFIFARNRIALRPCTAAVEEGCARGETGDFEGALACFRRAAAADRFDPWPAYHGGNTLLYLRRYPEAVESFRAVEGLAPGWYHCRADLWLAERMAEGSIDHALFQRLRRLDGSPSPEGALAEARAGLAQKDLPLLHLLAGQALGRLGRDAEAERAFRRGLALAGERDVKTRLLMALGACSTVPSGEQAQLLGEAVELAGNLVSAATASLLLRRIAPEA